MASEEKGGRRGKRRRRERGVEWVDRLCAPELLDSLL
jgi:hypothetical protein